MQPSSYNELVYMTQFLNDAAHLKQLRGQSEDILKEQKRLLCQANVYICQDCHLLHELRKGMKKCTTCRIAIERKTRCKSHLAVECKYCIHYKCPAEFIYCEECNTQICKECAIRNRICRDCFYY